MTPTPEQIKQALQNMRKPPRNRSELLYKALQHVRLSAASKTKSAACDEASGLYKHRNLQTQYGSKTD